MDLDALTWKITFPSEWGLVGWQSSRAACPDLRHVVQFLRFPFGMWRSCSWSLRPTALKPWCPRQELWCDPSLRVPHVTPSRGFSQTRFHLALCVCVVGHPAIPSTQFCLLGSSQKSSQRPAGRRIWPPRSFLVILHQGALKLSFPSL